MGQLSVTGRRWKSIEGWKGSAGKTCQIHVMIFMVVMFIVVDCASCLLSYSSRYIEPVVLHLSQVTNHSIGAAKGEILGTLKLWTSNCLKLKPSYFTWTTTLYVTLDCSAT